MTEEKRIEINNLIEEFKIEWGIHTTLKQSEYSSIIGLLHIVVRTIKKSDKNNDT